MAHVTDNTISAADVAVAAEARGYASLFVTEHTHIPAQGSIKWRDGQEMPEIYKRLYDPLIGLAHAAALTSTIRLGTGVLVIGQREPIATAKQLASLDRLSGGRLILGTGYGWLAAELAQHGIAWSNRRAVWRDHLAALRELWTAETASYSGQHVSFGPTWSFPKPRQARVPVWLGSGASLEAFGDVVEFCDGWMPVEGTELIDRRWAELRKTAEQAGRDVDSLSLAVYGSSGDSQTLDWYQSIGAHHVVVGVDASTADGVLAQLDLHQHLVGRYA
jgi:probable F420-dependent oxidoreductase